MDYEDKDAMFDFEKSFCLDNLRVWWNEALNLFYSAEVLYEFEDLKDKDIFEKMEMLSPLFSSGLTNKYYFNHRVQRMLWAYGFENLLKMIILRNVKNENSDITDIPFQKIKSHSLICLSQVAKFDLSEPETFYFGVLEKCSVWAGRYPLPVKSDQMYESRKALSSSEALLERSKQTWERYFKGEISRIESESDVMHSGISSGEYTVYKQTKLKLMKIAEDIIK